MQAWSGKVGYIAMPSTRKKVNKSGQTFFEIRVSRGRGKSYLTKRWYVPDGWSQRAIDRELAVDPFNGHLQKQAALLHKAQITTIDSFCLFVIRNHFHEIGLDPGFRVADEGELKLLQQDTLNELLDKFKLRA